MKLLGSFITTIAIATAACAFLLALAGFTSYPGGSHWGEEKRIAFALSGTGFVFWLVSLVACVFAAAHRRYEPERSSGRLKWAVAMLAISLLLLALTPPF